MSQKKDTKTVIQQLEEQGWLVTLTRRNSHWKAMSPTGTGIVFFPGTPGDSRSLANTKAQLRKFGAEIT
jgi:hypothetical protein